MHHSKSQVFGLCTTKVTMTDLGTFKKSSLTKYIILSRSLHSIDQLILQHKTFHKLRKPKAAGMDINPIVSRNINFSTIIDPSTITWLENPILQYSHW